MYSSPVRFSRMRHMGTAVTLAGAVGGFILVVVGLMRMDQESWIWPIAAGASIMGAAATAFVLIRLALKIESNTSRLYNLTHELHEVLNRFESTLATIDRNASLSDVVKSIAHRAREWEALRGAIYEEIRNEDFEAVLRLIDTLAQNPAYKDEAERLRQETRGECAEAFRSKLRIAISHVTKLLDARQWVQAKHEIERLERLMPAERNVRELWDVMEQKRDQYKQALLRDWNKAASDSNVEQGIELLKELDQYLTPEEVRSAEAAARELFKERLQQLGIQFQFAVKEKRWRDALESGLQIIDGFPNSRMAAEIRDKLTPLRERAGIPTDVEVTARRTEVCDPTESPQG